MNFVKKLIVERFPAAISMYLYFKLMIETRSLTPVKIRLKYSQNELFANVKEPRGYNLLRNKGTGQFSIKSFWRTSLLIFKPTVALDIGANYGEVVLDCKYPKETKDIIVIEANPALLPYLKRSIESHQQCSEFRIYNNIAGDTSDEVMKFYVDRKSSGRSTALKDNFVKDSLEVEVKSIRVDDLVSGLSETGPILFKIDVEGFEPFVLQGMTKLLQSDRELIGCIEFNKTSLEKNDINRAEYYDFLNQHFSLGLLQKDGSVQRVNVVSDQVIERYFKNKYQEGDILLFSSGDLLQRYVDASI